jgi:hypothetical protein
MTDLVDLIDELDKAAAKLLEAAGFGATVVNGAPAQADLPERVKAFQAVAAWAERRNELRPPDKEPSKFDRIKRQFSPAAKGRRRAAEAESGSGEPVEPSAEPSPEPAVNGSPADLFDA